MVLYWLFILFILWWWPYLLLRWLFSTINIFSWSNLLFSIILLLILLLSARNLVFLLKIIFSRLYLAGSSVIYFFRRIWRWLWLFCFYVRNLISWNWLLLSSNVSVHFIFFSINNSDSPRLRIFILYLATLIFGFSLLLNFSPLFHLSFLF